MKLNKLFLLFSCIALIGSITSGCQDSVDKATVDAAPAPPANAVAPSVNPNKPQPVGGGDSESGSGGKATVEAK